MKNLILIILSLQLGMLSAKAGMIHISSGSGMPFTLFVCNIQYNASPVTELNIITENDQPVIGKIVMNDSIGYSFYVSLQGVDHSSAKYGIEKTPPLPGLKSCGYQIRQYSHGTDDDYKNTGHGRRNDAYKTFSEDDFTKYMAAVKEQSLETTSLSVAEEGLLFRWITTDQVLKIMKLFSLENTTLKFAEFAWPHLSDPENNYLINKGFVLSNSIEEYSEYCKRH